MLKAIKREVATYYLLNQYYNARKYLEVNIRSRNRNDIDEICERVRCAGIAYASAAFLSYNKDCSFTEECYFINNSFTGTPKGFSRYNDFIKDMEDYITNIRNSLYSHRECTLITEQKNTYEKFFEKLYDSALKHGIFQGNYGSGKTKAIQLDVERILVQTNDDIIIIDNDGLYEEFCSRNNGKYINIDYDGGFLEYKINTINNRLIVLDIHRIYEHNKSLYALKALKYAYKRVNQQAELTKYIWIYLDEVDEILSDNYFQDMLVDCRRKNGIITIATNKLVDIVESDNMRRLLLSIEYVRFFNQSSRNQELLSKYFFIDSKMLEFEDIDKSLILIKGETLDVKGRNKVN